jgi:hypothetical protein
VRALVVVFDATVNPTFPDPVPLAPDVIEIHNALLAAVHAHPAGIVTATVPLPPLPPTLWETGASVLLHVPAWVTVTVWPPSNTAPVRLPAPVFGAMV